MSASTTPEKRTVGQTAPLQGMRIVDISQQLPGPYASMLLQELGAHVTKVEPPTGDPSRRLDPQMFSLVNRDKTILTLDLKNPEDVAHLHALVRTADVFIEGFRPGVVSRLGADWTTLAEVNEALVYCSISASGQDGPYAQAPMHDLNLQGLGGLEESKGIGVPWVDLGTATSAALAIAGHWQQVRESGRGVYLDAAMLDTAVLWAAVKGSAYGRAEPTYGIFDTRDGRKVAVAILEDHIWTRLCEAFGWQDWRDEPALGAYVQRIAAAETIQDRLQADCGSRTFGELLDLARRHDLPLTPAGDHLDHAARTQLATRRLVVSDSRDGARRVPVPLSSLIRGQDRWDLR